MSIPSFLSDEHWKVIKWILRYFCGTIDFCLTLSSSNFVLNAYTDANYVGYPNDRKNMRGFVIFLGGNLISWEARKQKTISRSPTKANDGMVSLRSLLYEIGIPHHQASRLLCDTYIGTIYLMTNPIFHARMKHIKVDFHFVHDMNRQRHLDVRFVSSNHQIIDALTKPLPKDQFT